MDETDADCPIVSKEKQKEAKGVDSVTDYVEEKEVSSDSMVTERVGSCCYC